MKNEKVEPQDLINWQALSRLITGADQNIRRNKRPKKYEPSVRRLIKIMAVFVRWANAR